MKGILLVVIGLRSEHLDAAVTDALEPHRLIRSRRSGWSQVESHHRRPGDAGRYAPENDRHELRGTRVQARLIHKDLGKL